MSGFVTREGVSSRIPQAVPHRANLIHWVGLGHAFIMHMYIDSITTVKLAYM